MLRGNSTGSNDFISGFLHVFNIRLSISLFFYIFNNYWMRDGVVHVSKELSAERDNRNRGLENSL